MSRTLSNRRAAHRPIVTAGLKCAPETCPTAYAIVTTDRPKARETPSNPTPSWDDGAVRLGDEKKDAPKIAVPQPPSTSQKVPRSSAPRRFRRAGVVTAGC